MQICSRYSIIGLMDIITKIKDMFVSKVYAASLGETLQERIGSLEGSTISDEASFIDAIVRVAVPIAVISVVVLVIFAGYTLMSSQGNPDKIKEGKDLLTNAIIGFLVIILSVAILLLLSNSLGLNIYQ